MTGAFELPALTIALVHLFFNAFAVIFIYGIKWLREKIPLLMAEKLAELAAKKRIYAFLYLFFAFFALPGACIMLTL